MRRTDKRSSSKYIFLGVLFIATMVVTFLSILDLTRKQEIDIKQESNFDKIYISEKVNNE